jgi:hypothetical protein
MGTIYSRAAFIVAAALAEAPSSYLVVAATTFRRGFAVERPTTLSP